MSANDGGPAFPAIDFVMPQDLAKQQVARLGYVRGMSLRDYFAAAALQGMHAGRTLPLTETGPELFAKQAYEQADAMLTERQK